MSRSDLVVSLAKAGASGDRPMLNRTVKALAEEARARQQYTYADRLTDILGPLGDKSANRLMPVRSRMPDAIRDTVIQVTPARRMEDLVLPATVVENLTDLVEEHRAVGLMRANGLEPRHTILLIGAPGNGKTSLAEAIAAELGCAFLVVRYEALIGSYLGETAANLRVVLDYAATMPCVLFFDEIDAIGKDRSEPNETGEAKRIVNSLLVQMDAIPSHCVLVGATNHPEMLDRAIWRRFELALELPNPAYAQVTEWFSQFLVDAGSPPGISLQGTKLRGVGAVRA